MKVEELVGRRVREMRELRGMTQEQLGAAIGELLGKPWPRQTVSAAEGGRRAFTAVELVAIARALSFYVGALFTPSWDMGAPAIELSPGSSFELSEIHPVLIERMDVQVVRALIHEVKRNLDIMERASKTIHGEVSLLDQHIESAVKHADGSAES